MEEEIPSKQLPDSDPGQWDNFTRYFHAWPTKFNINIILN